MSTNSHNICVGGTYFDWQLGVHVTVEQWNGVSTSAKCRSEHGIPYMARVCALEPAKN